MKILSKNVVFISNGNECFSAGRASTSLKRNLLLLTFLLTVMSSFSQTTYDWLNTAPDGNFRQGAFGARWNPGGLFDEPPYGIVQFNNNNQVTMTNNVGGTWSQHKINFGSSATTGRTIGGNAIQFFDFGGTWPFIQNQSSANHTINFPILVGTSGTFNLELIANAGNLVFGGTLGNQGKNILVYGNNSAVDGTNRSVRLGGVTSGAGKLIVSQFGVAKLNATHTYTGNTEIDNGELWIESAGSIAAGSAIFVGNGGQLTNVTKFWISNASGGTTVSNAITINNGNANTRYLGGLNSSGTHTFSGNITNNSTTGGLNLSALTAGGATTFSGVISGASAIVVEGSGTTILSGANTYTGNTTIASGATLRLGASGVIPDASNLTLSGGTLSTGATIGNAETMGTLSMTASSTIALGTGSHNIVFANSSATTFNTGTILTITGWTGTSNGNSSGTEGRLFVGNTAGGLTGLQLSRIRFNIGGQLRGAMQLSTGEVVPTGGTVLYWNGTGTWSAANTWSLTEGGPYNQTWVSGRHAIFNVALSTITGFTTNVASITANENVTIAASGTMGTGAAGGGTCPIFVASGRTLTDAQNLSSALGSAIIKNGPGVFSSGSTVSAALPGGVTLNEGVLVWSGVNGFGSSALTINGGALSNNNTTAKSPPHTSILVNGDFAFGNSSLVPAGTGNLTFAGAVALASSSTRTITLGNTGVYSLNGVVSGSGSNLVLNATLAGTLALGGANTYTGSTTINGGTLRCGIAGALPSTTNVTLANTAGATLNLNNFAQTIASISGGGATGGNIATGSAILTVNQSSNTTYAGVISGTGALVKSGTGILTLSGANTYTGATTISGGTLRLGAANVLAAGNVVLSGGTFSTGATTGNSESVGTLNLTANSSIALGTGAHTLNFTNSSGVAWTVGATLTITGWTGTPGVTGTAGKIFIGTATGTLTATQLGQITFTGYTGTPILLSTGELVPPPLSYTWNATTGSADWQTPASWTPARNTPATNDILNFTNGGTSTATNIPVETIGKLIMNNNTNITLQAAAGNTLTLQGGTGTDLDIPSGCSLTLGNGANAMSMNYTGTGHVASIAGTLTLSNANTANTYTSTNSTTTITGTLNIGGTLTGNVANNGTVNFNRSYTYADIISGTGTVTNAATGTLIWSGANTYTGITTINAGSTLQLNGAGAISNSSNITNNGAIIINKTYTYDGVISGSGTLTIQGASSTLTLTNAHTFTGATTINGGGTPGLTISGNGRLVSDIVNNNDFWIQNTGTWIYNGVISGAGTIWQWNNPGTFVATNTNTNGGFIQVGGGCTFQIGNGGTSGSIGSGFSSVQGTVIFNRSDAFTYNGNFTGAAGQLVKNGTGTLTFGTNTFGTGSTTINLGVLQIASAERLWNTGTMTLNGGTFSTGASVGYTETVGTLSLTANSGINLGTGNHTLTFANSSAVGWTGTLTITGWTGTGGASGTGGKIFVGVGGLTPGQLGQISFSGFPGTPIILGTGELVPPSAAAGTYAWNATSGSADWTTPGSWTPARNTPNTGDVLNFTNGGSSTAINVPTQTVARMVMSNNTSVTLEAAAGNTLTLQGGAGTDLDIPSGCSLTLGNGANAMSMAYSGTGHVASIAGALTLSNANTANTYTSTNSTTTITGTLNIGGTLIGNVVNNGTVNFNRSYTYADIISGTGTVTNAATGTLIWTGANTYTGVTTINAGSTLSLGNGATTGSISNSSNVTNNGTLIINRSIALVYGGIISGSGSLTKSGTGNLVLTNDNTYTGTTTIDNGGVFQLGNNSTAGSISNSSNLILNGSSQLEISRTNDYTYSGVISGTGSVKKAAHASTFFLTGTNTYTSFTSIVEPGRLSLGNGGTTGSISNSSTVSLLGVTAELLVNRSNNFTLSNEIGFDGSFTKLGSGITTLTNVSNYYTGTTTVTAGTLQLGADNVIDDFSNVILNGGSFSTGSAAGFNETVGTLNLNASSTIALGTGTHTLTFTNSSAVSWTAATTLTITGWSGIGGASGTAGQIFVGVGGLTAGQLGQISFSGFPGTPIILGTGELVPPAPSVTYTWTGGTSTDWGTVTNWNPSGVPTAIDNVIINAPGTNFDLSINSARTVNNFEISGTGNFSMTAAGSLTVSGAVTTGGTPSASLDCASTFIISNGGSQPIPALNYGNLNASGGDRVLPNGGTVRVCGTFTRGAGTYTTTNNTFEYNGTSAQTIATGNYNNLTISQNRGAGVITLPSGTITIAGNFVASLSNYTSVVSGNTIDFSSALSQNIPAFNYASITNTGNGSRTWASSGVIDINNTFTPSTGSNTVTGSTVRYSSTAATAYTLTSFTSSATPRHYNHIELVGGASTTWTLASGFNMGCAGNFSLTGSGIFTVANNTTANTMTVDGTLILSGAGTVRVSNTATATTVGTLNVTGNSTISNGILNLVGAGAGTTVQGNFSTNDLTISGTGQLLMDAASNTSVASATVNGNLLVTSTTANAIDLGSGMANSNNIINIKGNFTKSGTGTLGFTGTFTTTAGYNFNGTLTQQINFSGANMTAGSFTVAAGSTVQLASNVTLGSNASASGFSTAGSGVIDFASFAIVAGNAANTFSLSSTGTFRTTSATGVAGSLSGFTVGNCSFASGGTFVFTGTSVNTGFATFTGITTANQYTISWNGATSLTLDKTMNLNVFNFTNSGLVFLGNFNITLASAAGALTGSSFSATKMFVTNGTGILIRSVLAVGTGLPFTWPIGENTGTTDYSPVTIASISGAGINGSIGLRVIDGVQGNMSPAVSYLSRYWPMTVSGFNSGYALTGATFTYDAANDVVVGPEATLKVNSFSSSTSLWTEYTSSVASPVISTSAITGTTMPTGGSSATYDMTGRIDVPVYFQSVASANWTAAPATTWEVSTDPLFVTPAGVPATATPNAANSRAIFVRNGHTMTVSTTITVDSVVVRSGGRILVTNNSFTVANGTGTDLTVASGGTIEFTSASDNALITNAGSTTIVNGLMKQSGSGSPDVTNGGSITIGATGTYEHGRNAGIIPTCTWTAGSLCLLSAVTANVPTGLTQSFHHFTVNTTLTANVNCSGALQTINGKFKITTNHASNAFALGSDTPFTLIVADSTIITNGILNITNGTGVMTLNANGPLVINGSGSALTKRNATATTINFNNNFIQNAGLFDFNEAGSTSSTVNFYGDVVMNGTVGKSGGGTPTANFIKSGGGTQTWTFGGTNAAGLVAWNVGNGATTNTVQLLSNVPLSTSAHTFAVQNGATFNMGPYILSGTNTAFTLNATGAIKLGHAAGIVTAPTLDGNVRTLTRVFPGTASYFYNGTANQFTGNALPSTLITTGNINIESSPGIVVTLINNNTTTPTFNLLSGLFAAGNTQQLNITTGGTVNASGGDWVTGVNAGLLNFPGTGTFAGNSSPYNVHISGGVNFGSGTVTIQNGGTFRINGGGFVNTNAPFYAVGSTLQYWVNTTYGRGLEWSASSGRGFPHHVSLGNNSLLNPADALAVDANVPLRTGGDVSIDLNSAIYMDFSGNNMIEDLIIAGSLSMTGQISGSGTSGSDIYVAGNWTNNGSGANFFPNNRGVFLNGTGTQNISGTNISFPAFPFLLIDKTAGSVTLSRDIQVSNTLTFTGSNVANINASTFTVFVSNTATGAVNRVGSGHVIGNLRRAFAIGDNTYNFTVGDASAYAPVNIAANSVTVSGSMTASTTTPDHPQIASSGLDNTKSVNRYWSISQTGLTLTNYNPTFNFVAGDVDGGVNTNNLLVGRHNAGWTYPTVGTRTATSTEATGLTAYGDFALAECRTPAVFTVTGGGSYCSGGSGLAVGLSGSESFVSYQLRLDGVDTGSPVTGTGSAISFGNQTMAGDYSVVATNLASVGCSSVMTGTVNVTVIPTVTPDVSISSSPAGSICVGTPVTFTATGQFGGATPIYQWQLNGSNVGTNSTSYVNASLNNGDLVRCIFTSSEVCPAPASDTSNVITMSVLAFQTPAVSIAASPSNNICAGENVTFTATPTFGGGAPSYQWRLNGANVGTNSPTYSNVALASGNQVDCILTSDYQCLLTPTANSNIVSMTVTAAPQVNAGFAVTTCGLTPYVFANGANNSNTTGIVWTENGAGSITSGATTLTPTYTPAAGDLGNVVTFTLTGTGNAPCGTVIDQVALAVTPFLNWYVDADNDGFGAPGIPLASCTNPGGRVNNNQDCCDTNADVNPLTEWWADIDGDGYGSFIFDNGCFTGVGCSNATWLGLIPYYPGAHSNIPYALDCNDNSVSVNPGMNEVCGNNTDDDCNGTIDIGCTSPQNDAFANASSVTVNNPNAYYPNCQIFNGSVTNAGISAQGNPANVSVGAGRDVWYRFVAPSTGVRITVQPSGFDAVIELRTAAHPVGQVDVENVNNNIGGLEILNTVSLTAGTTYYVGVRNYNATNTGTFTICISPLLQSGCGLPVPVGGFSTCANYKAIYRGAATYTFNFTGTGGAAAFPFVTTVGTTTGLIPLSTPALDIRYGGIYSCRVDANYALVNGLGAAEPLTMIGTTASANCTNIQIINQPNVEVRFSQRCPATITRSTFLFGTAVSSNTIICGATGYRYRFTKVTDCTGVTTAGLPFTSNTPGNTPFLNLTAVFPSTLPSVGYWRVEIAPIFSHGLGNYGPAQVIQVTGTSASLMLEEMNEGQDAEKMKNSFGEIGLYPNPNDGEMVNLNMTGLNEDELEFRIYDAMGKLIQEYQFIVDGSLNTVLVFSEKLTSGWYTIEFRSGDQIKTQRMVVQN